MRGGAITTARRSSSPSISMPKQQRAIGSISGINRIPPVAIERRVTFPRGAAGVLESAARLKNSGDAGADGVSGSGRRTYYLRQRFGRRARYDMNNAPTAPDVARPSRSILAHQPKVAYAG